MSGEIKINDIEIIIDNGTLTNQQKAIVLKVYNKVKNNIAEIINKLSNDTLEVSDVSNILFELVCYNLLNQTLLLLILIYLSYLILIQN